MNTKTTILIALIPNHKDWQIANEHNWYRIPVNNAPKIIRENRAKYIAFYFPAIFGEKKKWKVSHYAKINSITEIVRKDLFINEPLNTKSDNLYYKVSFEKIEVIPNPFVSRRGHRLIFISTTEERFFSDTTDFNNLFQSSFLEKKLEKLINEMQVEYEREWREYVNDKKFYYLDFAIWCKKGAVNIECDGDKFHMENNNVHLDKTRNNELESYGWSVLRFTTKHITEEKNHIKKTIYQTIKELGGALKVSEPEQPYLPRNKDDFQLGLFE